METQITQINGYKPSGLSGGNVTKIVQGVLVTQVIMIMLGKNQSIVIRRGNKILGVKTFF